jgi:hypothetical protein
MPRIDTVKLAALRDAHERARADYRACSERARDAQAEVARLRNPPPSGTPQQQEAAGRLLQLPVAALANLAADRIVACNVDPRTVRRVIDGQARADALRAESEALAPAVRRSGLLIATLTAYARSQE